MLNKFKVKKGIKTSSSGEAMYEIIPPGLIIVHSSVVVPDGWLLCDGTSYAKSSYPDLDAVLSLASYPFGSTVTNFSVPNLTANTPIASGTGAGLTARTVGATGGATTVTMAGANMPAHQHGMTNHTHSSTSVSSSGGHTHTMNAANSGNVSADHSHGVGAHGHSSNNAANCGTGTTISTHRAAGSAQNAGIGSGANATGAGSATHAHGTGAVNTGNQSANHTHNLTSDNNTVVSTGGTFTPTAINVENPYIRVSFIIKY